MIWHSPYNTVPTFKDLEKKPFENIVGKGENAETSIFSFSHNVFYPIRERNHHFSNINLSSANAFNMDLSENLLGGKRLHILKFLISCLV